MRDLFISLGHNSSAILAEHGVVKRGFEQERLDRVKSSSAYPREAIELCLGDKDKHVDRAYVSHWFDRWPEQSNKYLDLKHLESVATGIVYTNDDFTHHDAHAGSVVQFVDVHGWFREYSHIAVLDGFGTRQECFSFYDCSPGHATPKLMHRTYGYECSLGLMYQYVTEFVGLKPLQDEYKLLGYESRVKQVASDEAIDSARVTLMRQAHSHCTKMLKNRKRRDATNDLIDKAALLIARDDWRAVFKGWHALCDTADLRVWLAWCAQTFLEECVMFLLTALCGKSNAPLFLVGGCFYNVKLNRRIQTSLPGRKVIAHPLAGDQGAALGMRQETLPLGLCIGDRMIMQESSSIIGCEFVEPESWVYIAAELLMRNKIVNVVQGRMEFGPRALCNTTTFALPTRENVRRINQLNERDDAMPMAPVITRGRAYELFNNDELDSIPVSDRYMITTVAFNNPPDERVAGVAHKDPLSDVWTARPQVITGGDVLDLVQAMPDKCLINTSFNYHGEPIVFTQDHAMLTHAMQNFRAATLGIEPPTTLLVLT